MVFETDEVFVGVLSGNDDQKIEIVIKEDERNFDIRLLGYGEGIGWYVQKTIPVPIDQASALAKVFSKIHNASEKELIRHEDVLMEGKVVRFLPRSPLEIVKEDTNG